MRLVILTMLGFLASPMAAHAQAFGVTMGDDLTRFADYMAVNADEFKYQVTPPSPNAAFDTYIAQISPHEGLCFISGAKKLGNDEDKSILLFDQLTVALDKIYGRGEVIELGSMDASWIRRWTLDLPDDLNSIQLIREPSNEVYVNYIFANMVDCIRELPSFDTKGL